MADYERMFCEDCKHYEANHRHPNPLAVSRHWCKKCNADIRYVRDGYFRDFYSVFVPKPCYFNDYFEASEEYLKRKKQKEEFEKRFDQIIEPYVDIV